MYASSYMYYHDSETLEGYIAYDDKTESLRPGILVALDWSGRNLFACQKAEMLAEMGYIGFALDMYGQAREGKTVEEKEALMQPFMQDRVLLQGRMQAALAAMLALPQVDKHRIAAIGFCFGGLCVLDLARSGTDMLGVVSFHGLLDKPEHALLQGKQPTIKAKILALHGYDDPMVTPDKVNAFCHEMTEKQVDWQIHIYGQTQHAFTNPLAHDAKLGTVYNKKSEERALQAMRDFFQEIFA